jgi:hypothetical protein
VDSKADIIKTSNYAIRNNGTGTLIISGGTISAPNYSIYNSSSGTVNISGGAVSATGSSGYAVYNSTGVLIINGGTISATETSSYAVLHTVGGSVLLGGSPSITGAIRQSATAGNLGVIIAPEIGTIFAPGNKIYTLSFANYEAGNLAVENGKNFLANFVAANSDYAFVASGQDLVIESAENAKAACEAKGDVWENGKCNDVTPIRTPQIASTQISVKAIGNAIVMENLPQNARIEIYNLEGKRLRSNNPENLKILKIMVQTKGIYIVKINNATYRIAVK